MPFWSKDTLNAIILSRIHICIVYEGNCDYVTDDYGILHASLHKKMSAGGHLQPTAARRVVVACNFNLII